MVAFIKIAIAAASTLSAVNSLSLFNEYVDRALAIFNTPDELYSQYDAQQQNFFHIQKEVHVNDDTKPVPGKSPIEVCDYSTKQLLTLDEITISPNPPEAGANLTFTAKGTIDKTITDGAYVEVDVRYGFIKLIHQTYDICKEITKVDLVQLKRVNKSSLKKLKSLRKFHLENIWLLLERSPKMTSI